VNLTLILMVVALVTSGVGLGAIRGCVSQQKKVAALQVDLKRQQAENLAVMRIVKDTTEVRQRVERAKSHLDSLSGSELDAELDRLLDGSGGAHDGPKGPRPTSPRG
jgi:hypothetical protein